ncbi:MAG: nucleotide exchange factor GrpE [Verrucomicrobia bacterium]|nr:nucleotide exchange factor GrpE [Verrucomicrobiota bacterium]
MNKSVGLNLVKRPFYLGDAMLVAVAYLVYYQSKSPMGSLEILFCVVAVGLGAALGVTPFLLEYRAAVKLAEANGLATTVAQLQNLDRVASHISGATAQWQRVQEESSKTVCAAKEIADRMTAEAHAFTDFMQKFNSSEKATLRLEIEKLRRAENDWLQVLMRILDHVYALHQAALRSGQPSLVEQLGHFQNACYDVSRRIGLIPFVAATGQPFDPKQHRLVEEQGKVPPDACVSESIATGYNYQGQLIRLALVSLQPTVESHSPAASSDSASASSNKMRNSQLLDDTVSAENTAESISPTEQPPLI